jgi:dCMP deaminase
MNKQINYKGKQTEFTDLKELAKLSGTLFRRVDFTEQVIKKQEAFLQMEYAYGWANRCCHAKRRTVGAVLFKNRRPISCGYNGTPSGEDNNCEYEDENGNLVTKGNVIHAEANSLDKLTEEGSSSGSKDSAMFATTAPCLPCAIRIHNVKVSTVYFTEIYRGVEGLEHLIKHGVTIKHIDLNNEKITTIYQSEEDNNVESKINGIILCRKMLDEYIDGSFHKIINKAIF